MISHRIQCALAILFLALAINGLSGAPSDLRFRQFLQRSFIAPESKQDLDRYSVAELLSELVQSENGALESEELTRRAALEEPRFQLERGANVFLAPRERKAGCKNFFWKTFTSC
ncbi:somatostatin-1A-like [Anguilla rostrata]|uniref:somatostatin-1A-like n=1 Tax=Anguilla anguilla TaxID=7936 RepID=UPI0015AA6E3B|nr:somatostatin-1A-like [Anguilla anguilla]